MSSKTKYRVFILAVVALAVVWGLRARDTGYYVVSPTPTATQRASQSGATATPAIQTISYDDAVQQYMNSRIQFDQYCQGKPSSMVLKSGGKIMLDNRSGDARTIKVDGKAYSLAGYGYQIITLSKPSSALPYSIKIDCGTAVNVAQVLLQAQISQ